MQYGPSSEASSSLPTQPKIKKNLREIAFNDYIDSQNPNLRSMKSVNKSTENIKTRVRLSTDSLNPNLSNINTSFASMNPSISFEAHHSSQRKLKSINFTPNNFSQRRIPHRIRHKFKNFKFENGKKKIFKTELHLSKKRFIAVLPDG
jgi:uncharacterized FlaG/YvyC family protein